MDRDFGVLGRREFLGSAISAAFVLAKPGQVRGTAANSQIRFGILGCGGRGTVVGTGFVENAGARVTALADLFDDQLQTARKHFDGLQASKGYSPIDARQIFKGPESCGQIAASKEVDFILISTPPYFHPDHLDSVVSAGKHVYCEKPVAIDVPGAHRIISIGDRAEGKVSLAVGFQLRSAPPLVELTQRIHNDALGEIASGLVFYYSRHPHRPEWPNASPEEVRLRNWVLDRDLSGDIIVEQNIHVIDMCNWMLKGHPMKAEGICNRKVRTDAGNCKDNFNVLFTYADNVQVSFGSTQFGQPRFDAGVQLYGAEGNSEAHYDWRVNIAGKNAWDAGLSPGAGQAEFSATGKFRGALDQADPEKQKAFVASITSGRFLNEAAQGAEAALSAMLGREAAYRGQPLTWEALEKSKKVFDSKLDITKFR